jgi:hypothetical protein
MAFTNFFKLSREYLLMVNTSLPALSFHCEISKSTEPNNKMSSNKDINKQHEVNIEIQKQTDLSKEVYYFHCHFLDEGIDTDLI